MNINANEFLTDEQKARIAEAYMEKIIEAINGMPVTSIRKTVLENIQACFENEMFLEHMNLAAIGKALTNKIKEGI